MKRMLSLLLSVVISLGLMSPSFAASDDATNAADTLHSLGLFSGIGTDLTGSPIYDLDRAPTRQEAITMLVGLLGKKEAALNGTWDIPFTDVADWAKPFVGYAYENGLTSGTSATTFSGNDKITATQYLTFVLKVLGYEAGKDFQWDKAWELSDKIRITNGEYHAATQFTRGDVAVISLNTLSATGNHSDFTLVEELIAANVIPIQSAINAELITSKGTPHIWGVTMQCNEVEYDHQSSCWTVFSSNEEELHLTINACGKDQYQRPFEVDPQSGFFWGLTTDFDDVDGVNFQTQLNGVSIEQDKDDPSIAVVTIPPNTETEVWIYAGVRNGLDFIRYPYLMKITPENSTEKEDAGGYHAWYEVDDCGNLHINTNINSQNWGGYSMLIINHMINRNNPNHYECGMNYGQNTAAFPIGSQFSYAWSDEVSGVKSTDIYVFKGTASLDRFWDLKKEYETPYEAVSALPEEFVYHTTLNNQISFKSTESPLIFTDFEITYDTAEQKETYTAVIKSKISDIGEYSLTYKRERGNRNAGMSYIDKGDGVLTFTREMNHFADAGSGASGTFYISYVVYSMGADGNIICTKTKSNGIQYIFE